MVRVFADPWEKMIIEKWLAMGLSPPFGEAMRLVEEEIGRRIKFEDIKRTLEKVIMDEELTEEEYEMYLAFKEVIGI